MPVYNSGPYLRTAIESILSQSLKEFELILVDDGSTDGSSKLCDEFALHDQRIVVIHQKNGGICKARNAALKIAQGEYIAFSDHDDEFLPDLLQDAYDRAKSDNADILKFRKKEIYLLNGVNVKIRETKLNNQLFDKSKIRDNLFPFLNEKILECVWDGIYKRSFLIENAILFNEFYKAGGEDIDILLRMMAKANVFSTLDGLYYVHYIRAGFSTSAKYNQSKLTTCLKLGEKITKESALMSIPLDDFKHQYVRQIMFTMFNSSANILANPLCNLATREKTAHLKKLKLQKFLPNWFFKCNALKLARLDRKIAFSYFLLKYNFFQMYLILFRLRQKQLDYRAS